MLLKSNRTVTVLRPIRSGVDELGAPITQRWEVETVAGALISSPTTEDLGADRPEGVRVSVVVHFPKTYDKPLMGCVLQLPAPWPAAVRVVGDPAPYDPDLTPGQWNRAAECVAVDG